jgi:hypothetical protein
LAARAGWVSGWPFEAKYTYRGLQPPSASQQIISIVRPSRGMIIYSPPEARAAYLASTEKEALIMHHSGDL